MKRIAIALVAAALILATTAGCAWLCCDPCEGVDCPPNPCDKYCNPCQ